LTLYSPARPSLTSLAGRTALVTGAALGLGAPIARLLGARGAKIAVNCFPSPARAEYVGEADAFLASDAGCFITGQKLAVNGGNPLA
jgi:NAD(P)-dependent dehydrogenase (short-subunit alcohol dehydrogenase family)